MYSYSLTRILLKALQVLSRALSRPGTDLDGNISGGVFIQFDFYFIVWQVLSQV